MYKFFLVIHVLCGATALASGLLAILTRKGGKAHRKGGTVYYIAMYMVGATALVMTIMKYNPFLLSLALFSVYLSYTGTRSIAYWRLKEPYQPTLADKLPLYFALGTAVFMIGYPVYIMWLKHEAFVPVLSVFGSIMLVMTLRDISMHASTENFKPRNKMWLIIHISKMGGAYIASVTAFLVNAVHLNPGWIGWLLPTAVGTPLITMSAIKWRKKLKMGVAPEGKKVVMTP